MSFEITTAFVQQYKSMVMHLAQQKGSRLRACVDLRPSIVGMNYYFERIGATGTVTKQSRHEPTPIISTPHSRRRVSMNTEKWGEAVDSDDALKVLIDPENQYVIAAKNAFGRVMDDYIIDGALNTSYSGPDGATGITFPYSTQQVSDANINNLTSIDAGSTDAGHLSPQRMLAVKKIFDGNDVDPDEERYIVVGPFDIQKMLGWVGVSSADYNTVKALAEGAVDTYMGFKFIMSNRLPTAGASAFGPFNRTYTVQSGQTSADNLCFAWARTGIGLAMQEEVKTEIAKDPSLSFATRLYMEMVLGATRVEEARVVLVPVKES
jgi:hypothetical protein